MAITAGAWNGRFRVGIDISQSPSNPTWRTKSVTITVRFYVQTSYDSVNDSEILTLSGPGTGNDKINFEMRTAHDWRHVATRQYTRTLYYGSTYTATYKASLSGVFNGANPSETRSYTFQRREVGTPTRPGTPRVTGLGATYADVEWAAPSEMYGASINYYRVEADNQYEFTSVNFNEISENRVHRVAPLAPGTKYYVRVSASTTGGTTDKSYRTAFTTKALPPDPPTGLHENDVDATYAELDWSASVRNGAVTTSYTVQYARNSSFSGAISTSTTTNAKNISNLIRRTQYWWRVRANSSAGSSGWSAVNTFTTDYALPTPPSALTSSAADHDSVTLNWNAPTDNGGSAIAHYDIQRATNSAFTAGLVTLSNVVAPETYEVTGLTSNTTYYFRVRAQNVVGDSGWSNVLQVATTSGVPSAPTGIGTNGIGYDTAVTTFNAPLSDGGEEIIGYEGQLSLTSDFAVIAQTLAGDSPFEWTGLTRDTMYYMRIRAENANGVGAWSSTRSFTTLTGPPGAPGTPTASGVTANQYTVSATAPADNGASPIVGYQWQFTNYDPAVMWDDPEAIDLIDQTTLAPVTRLQREPATQYLVRVAAINANGFGEWSNNLIVTTLSGYTGKLRIGMGLARASRPAMKAQLVTNVSLPGVPRAPIVGLPGKFTIQNPLAATPVGTMVRIPGHGVEAHHAWTGTPNASTSTKTGLSRQLIPPDLATARAETWVGTFPGGGAGTASLEATGAPDGGSWRKITVTTAPSSTPMAITPNLTVRYTDVTPGVEYTASAYIQGSTANNSVRVIINWIDASGASIGSNTTVYTGNMTTGWVRHSSSGVAPANAVKARIIANWSRTADVGDWWGVAMPKLEIGSTPTEWEPRDISYTNLVLNPRPENTDPLRWRISASETLTFLEEDGETVGEAWDTVGGGVLYVDPNVNFTPAVGEWIAFGVDVKGLDPTTAANMRLTTTTYNGAAVVGSAQFYTVSTEEYIRIWTVRQVTAMPVGGYIRTLIWPSPATPTAGNGFRFKRAAVVFASSEDLATKSVERYFDGDTPSLYPSGARSGFVVGLQATAVPVNKMTLDMGLQGTVHFGGVLPVTSYLSDATLPDLEPDNDFSIGLVGTVRFQPYGDPLEHPTLEEISEELVLEPIGEWDD